jgi:protein phosphatase
MLETIRKALDKSGFWDEFKTNWVCLDAELMPWSAKAQALLKEQYAAVGSSAQGALREVVSCLEKAQASGLEVTDRNWTRSSNH